MNAFAEGVSPLLQDEFPPVQEVVLCLRGRHDVEERTELIAGLVLV
jgi:hypothetical protein